MNTYLIRCFVNGLCISETIKSEYMETAFIIGKRKIQEKYPHIKKASWCIDRRQ